MRFGAVLAAGVAAVVVGAVTYGYIADRNAADGDPVLAPPSGAAFGASQTLAEGPNRGSFSPDGRRVAVLDRAAVALADRGALQAFTPSSGRIVDFAWMPNSESVLIAEGPIPTGQVSVVNLDGTVKGTARLQPSVGFGAGYGMSVDSRGVQAAVIAVEREPIGGRERTDVAVIDLTSGAVRVLVTPDIDERRPVFVDDGSVAVTELERQANGGPTERVVIVDIESGQRRALDTRLPATVVGVTNDGEVVVAERGPAAETIVALAEDGSRRDVLLVLAEGQRAVATDPHALRLLVVESVEMNAPAGGKQTVTRLRAVDVGPRSADEGVEPG